MLEDEFVVGIFVIAVVAVVGIIAALLIASSMTSNAVFAEDVTADVSDCARANVSAVKLPNVPLPVVTVNADNLLSCLYGRGYTLSLHGDPITPSASN